MSAKYLTNAESQIVAVLRAEFKDREFTFDEFKRRFNWHNEFMLSDTTIRNYLNTCPRLERARAGRVIRYNVICWVSPDNIKAGFESYWEYKLALPHESLILTDETYDYLSNMFLVGRRNLYESMQYSGVLKAMRSSGYGLYFTLNDVYKALGGARQI